MNTKTPTKTETLAIFLITLLFYIYISILFASLFHHNEFLRIILTHIIGLLLIPIIFSYYKEYSIKNTFYISPVAIKYILLMIPIALSLQFILNNIIYIQQAIFLGENPSSSFEEQQKFFERFIHDHSAWSLIVFAVIPSICEEVLFRGFLLKGLLEKNEKVKAILLVGIFFGIIHQHIELILPIAILGIVFAYITYKVGSIIPALIGHFVFNSSTILIVLLTDPENLRKVEYSINNAFFILVIAGLIFILFFYPFIRIKPVYLKNQNLEFL